MITPEEDLIFRTYSAVKNYQYAQWFQETRYNGRTLTIEERKAFVKIVDETISDFTSGLPFLKEQIGETKNKEDDINQICQVVYSVELFVIMTMCDCMAAGKYFVIADTEYDKQFMRGKMKVILNEGFKSLYGHKEENKKKSEWFRLLEYIGHFPEVINRQYQELTFLLERQSKTSSWWRDIRNYEIHIDAEKLYLSRTEVIEESKEMMETLRLYNALLAVDHFLTNATACIRNRMVTLYREGRLKEE